MADRAEAAGGRTRAGYVADGAGEDPSAPRRVANVKPERGKMARHARAAQEPRGMRGRMQSGTTAECLVSLLRERRRVLNRVPVMPELTSDPIDAAKELEEQQLWLAVSDRREEIHDQIDAAVRLLIEGRYGRCIECGMAIRAARLRALPFALRCLACQERFEHRARPISVSHSWAARLTG